MKVRNIVRWTVASAVLLCCSSTFAQTTGDQKFTVTVPTKIAITPPANTTLTHDESDNDQAFPAQQWEVQGNTLAGVSVSFATATAFTHTTDSSFKRDVKLDLAVHSSTGPASWTLGQATDTTAYASSDEVATVTASSNGVGRATFDLAVTFITDSFGSFAAGDYETTVTGTVTSN